MNGDRDVRDETRKAARGINVTLAGLLVGVAVGFAGAFGGFSAFIIVLFLAVVGTTVGLVVDGRIDLSKVLDRDDD